MKSLFWIKQPILQILLYFIFYQILIFVLEKFLLIRFDISVGISMRYMFYLFVAMSSIFSFFLFFSKSNTSLNLFLFILSYSIISIAFFSINSKYIIMVLGLSILSVIISNLILKIKLRIF